MFKFPLNIEIDLTYKCNYNCLYCRNGLIKERDELSINVIESLINELRTNNIFSVNISGGEPLLHKDFSSIIKLLSENNITWNLTTNGSLIDEKIAKKLKENNINCIFITLTGMNDEIDSYHKNSKKTFSKTINCIKLCKSLNIDVYVGYLLTPLNLKCVDEFIDFIIENDLKAKLMKVKPLGNSLQNQNLYIDDIKYKETLSYMTKKLGNKLIIGEQNEKAENINCMAGITSCVIGADYGVYPCVMFLGEDKVKCGNVKYNTLYDIWNNSTILKEFHEPRIFESQCKLCSKREKCNGGCRGKSYLQKGSYKEVESGCFNDL